MGALLGINPRHPVPTLVLADLIDRQKRWAAKGGRGRKKPKSLAREFLFSGRKRGRPKQAKRKLPTYKYGRRYASRWYQQDRTVICKLIAIAPQWPAKHIRKLVTEQVEQSKAYGAQRDHSDRYKSPYQTHINRIMLRIDRTFTLLRLPHERYIIENKDK